MTSTKLEERIKELKLIVAQSFDPIKHYSADEYEIEFDRRFAELIIKECALVVFKNTGPKSSLRVLEHFGVEE